MKNRHGNRKEIAITTPPGFNFWRTARSHGWSSLAPFSHDPRRKELSRVLLLNDGMVVHCTLSQSNRDVRVVTDSIRALRKEHINEITHQLLTSLRLDEDFRGFHREATKHPGYKWIATTGSGRMLRAPTIFEDVVKMICTTNCTWALTTLMTTNLVGAFGKQSGRYVAFPTAEAIAGSTEKYLRTSIKSGYRSPYLIELADTVASGKLDLDSWRTSPLPTDLLFKEMVKVKGIGPYAAGNIMRLVGRYDYLGLDSWVRAKYYELHTKGRKVKDGTIEKHYKSYGAWRGLFFWLEMTRFWHEEKFGL